MKHISFNESTVLNEFARIAHETGLIKTAEGEMAPQTRGPSKIDPGVGQSSYPGSIETGETGVASKPKQIVAILAKTAPTLSQIYAGRIPAQTVTKKILVAAYKELPALRNIGLDVQQKADLFAKIRQWFTDTGYKFNKLNTATILKYTGGTTQVTAAKSETKLYDITGETGEQLVETAHPGGGTRTELTHSKTDENLVETIVEQQKVDIEVAKSIPTGKYAELVETLTKVADELDEMGYGKLANVLDDQLNKLAEGETERPFLGKSAAFYDDEPENKQEEKNNWWEVPQDVIERILNEIWELDTEKPSRLDEDAQELFKKITSKLKSLRRKEISMYYVAMKIMPYIRYSPRGTSDVARKLLYEVYSNTHDRYNEELSNAVAAGKSDNTTPGSIHETTPGVAGKDSGGKTKLSAKQIRRVKWLGLYNKAVGRITKMNPTAAGKLPRPRPKDAKHNTATFKSALKEVSKVLTGINMSRSNPKEWTLSNFVMAHNPALPSPLENRKMSPAPGSTEMPTDSEGRIMPPPLPPGSARPEKLTGDVSDSQFQTALRTAWMNRFSHIGYKNPPANQLNHINTKLVPLLSKQYYETPGARKSYIAGWAKDLIGKM